MKEADLQRKLKKYLHDVYGAQCIKHHGGPYSEAGVADIICSINGRYAAFEVKCPGKKPSPLQLLWLEKYKKTGAIVGVVTCVQDVDILVREIIDNT